MQFRVFSIPATGSPDLEEELNVLLRYYQSLGASPWGS